MHKSSNLNHHYNGAIKVLSPVSDQLTDLLSWDLLFWTDGWTEVAVICNDGLQRRRVAVSLMVTGEYVNNTMQR